MLIALSVASYRSVVLSATGADRIRHTHRAIESLTALLADAHEIDAAYRGFTIVGDQRFLAPYEEGRGRVAADLAAIATLTSGSPSQQKRIARLNALIDQKLQFAAEVVRLRREVGAQAAAERVASGEGLRVSADIRAVIGEIGEEAERLLLSQQAIADRDFSRIRLLRALGILGSILVMLFAGWLASRDATARWKIDRALRESEERLRQERDRAQGYLDMATVILLALDNQGRITLANRFACTVLGWTESELLGRNWFETCIVAAARDHVRNRFTKLLGGETSVSDNTICTRSGDERRIQWRSTVLRDAGGRVIGTFSSGIDITEQHQATESLRTAEERMRYALQNANIGVWDIDYATGVNQWFGTLEAQFGLSPGTFGGTFEAFLAGIHPDDLAAVLTTLEAAARSGDDFKMRYRSIHPDGTVRWLSGMGRLHLENGKPVRGVGISMDVTEHKVAEEELGAARDAAQAANQAKSEFLANMSHEIRTPMNGIIGMTDLVLDTELTLDQRENLRIVKSSADALLTLINDILDFSRMEVGKFELDPTDFNPRDAIGDAANIVALNAHRKGLELIVDVDSDVPRTVRGDVGRLRQILVNLLGNAIKFTARGEILLKVSSGPPTPSGGFLNFSITDTGIGIAPDRLGSIFEAFTQADGSVTRTYGGTGLGLSISSQLVQLMGGRLWVESEPGRGSTFHFTVTLALAQNPVVPVAGPDATAIDGLRVLVVDDNATNRRLLERLLVDWRMVPTLVASAAEALATLRSAQEAGKSFPLVLSDVQMPDMDGFTFVQVLRNDPSIAAAGVVMLSSSSEPGDAARCLVLGIFACLPKPVRSAKLREAIALALAGAPVAARPQSPAMHLQPGASQMGRVLLVDDNRVNQLVAQRLLEKRGYTIVVANHGREALALLADAAIAEFNCVLMDVQMPEMDGFECTAIIRDGERASGAHLQIIAMTAHAMKGDEARCLAAGMDGYVSKPLQPEEFFEIVARHVGISRSPEGPLALRRVA